MLARLTAALVAGCALMASAANSGEPMTFSCHAVGSATCYFHVPSRQPEWVTEKDEKDPFDNKEALYVASALAVGDSSSDWAIRCIEGRVSMLVNMRTTGAVANSGADVSIAVPGLPVRAEIGVVLASTSSETSVQFGSEYTIDYLSGAKNVSVRLDIQGVRITEDFPVGPDLDGVVARALKACHKLQR
jgi:hypothetical protein